MEHQPAEPKKVRWRAPLGVYLFTLTYALGALFLLFTLGLAIPSAYATTVYINPWETATGPVVATVALTILISSIATMSGSRVGRAVLTSTLALSFVGVFVVDMLAIADLEVPNCSTSVRCTLSEWGRVTSPRHLVPWLWPIGWLAVHCWYFFGRPTRHYYARAKDA